MYAPIFYRKDNTMLNFLDAIDYLEKNTTRFDPPKAEPTPPKAEPTQPKQPKEEPTPPKPKQPKEEPTPPLEGTEGEELL